jgi:hypothetical protein
MSQILNYGWQQKKLPGAQQGAAHNKGQHRGSTTETWHRWRISRGSNQLSPVTQHNNSSTHSPGRGSNGRGHNGSTGQMEEVTMVWWTSTRTVRWSIRSNHDQLQLSRCVRFKYRQTWVQQGRIKYRQTWVQDVEQTWVVTGRNWNQSFMIQVQDKD